MKKRRAGRKDESVHVGKLYVRVCVDAVEEIREVADVVRLLVDESE